MAHIDLSAFQPEGVVNYFYPESKLKISNAQLNVTLDIDAAGKDRIRVDLNGTMPQLQINSDGSDFTFNDQRLRAELILEKQLLKVHVTDFVSAAPRLNLTGEFSIDDKITGVDLLLAGGSVDVAGVRSAALSLMGHNQDVADLFDVLRGGEVPKITVTAKGSRLSDLEMIENYTIAGQMQTGRIFIPDLDFDLNNVSGDAMISGGVLKGTQLKAKMGDTSGTDGTLSLDLGDSDLFELGIHLKADLAQLPPVLQKVIDDREVIAELTRITDVAGQATGRLWVSVKGNNARVNANVSAMSLNALYDRVPYPVAVSQGKLVLEGDRITLSDMNMNAGKAVLGGIEGRIDWTKAVQLDLRAAALKLDAAQLRAWLPDNVKGDQWADAIKTLSGGAEFKDLSLVYRTPQVATDQVEIGGGIVLANLATDMLPAELMINAGAFRYRRQHLALEGLVARMGKSSLDQANVTLDWRAASAMQGSATGAELDLEELFPWVAKLADGQQGLADLKSLSGKVWLTNPSVNGPAENPAAWQWDTSARLQQIRLESTTFGAPIMIASAELKAAKALIGQAAGTQIELKPAQIDWGPSHLTVAGTTGLTGKGLQLNLRIAADELQWPQIEHVINQTDPSENPDDGNAIRGTISVRTDRFQYDELLWQPVEATLTLSAGQTNLAVARASLCSIDFSGHINFSGERIDLHLVPAAKDMPLQPTFVCLSKNKNMATGQFDFGGELKAKAKTANLRKSISGELSLAASGGRIHSLGVLSKIFSILNVTEIYRGQLPELTGEGFAYETMTIVADIEKSKLTMRQCTVEAPSMGLACEGDIDMAKGEMDLVILVAPFRTVDRIVKNIPIVGGIMGGKLISIPFRAKGELGNPTVIPLSPTAVGSGVLGILERTLKLPINLIQPLFNQSEPDEESSETTE